MATAEERALELTKKWESDPRWKGATRPYSASDVVRLQGSIVVEQTLAKMGADRLWNLLHDKSATAALGTVTGNQAVQLVERLNNSLARLDQIESLEGRGGPQWYLPIVADAEAGFGGNLNCFELMKSMIKAGAAGVHFEDQLSSEKKCGHLGGKVLIPTQEAIRHLVAARLAADRDGASRKAVGAGLGAVGADDH